MSSSQPRPHLTGPDHRGRLFGGRYLPERVVGRGGTATVYTALDRRLGRRVALKVIHPEHARSDDQRRRIRQEARMVALLDHPNVLPLLDYGEEALASGELLAFLVMPLLDGVSLRELVLSGPVAWARALALVRQLLAGVAAIHAAGALHRDLKAGNCLLTRRSGDDHLWIVDFGLAKARRPGLVSLPPRSSAGAVVGTLPYLAPEQARGLAVDERADLYAVGVILFELLTRRLPFTGTEYDVLTAIVERAPPSPRSLAPAAGIPEDIERVVLRALTKEPSERFASAAAMDAALVEVARAHGLGTRVLGEAPASLGCDEARRSLAAWTCFDYGHARRMAKLAARHDPAWSPLALLMSLVPDEDGEAVSGGLER